MDRDFLTEHKAWIAGRRFERPQQSELDAWGKFSQDTINFLTHITEAEQMRLVTYKRAVLAGFYTDQLPAVSG